MSGPCSPTEAYTSGYLLIWKQLKTQKEVGEERKKSYARPMESESLDMGLGAYRFSNLLPEFQAKILVDGSVLEHVVKREWDKTEQVHRKYQPHSKLPKSFTANDFTPMLQTYDSLGQMSSYGIICLLLRCFTLLSILDTYTLFPN